MNITVNDNSYKGSNVFIKTLLSLIILLSYNIIWFLNGALYTYLSFTVILISSLALMFIYRISLQSFVTLLLIQFIILLSWVINSTIGENIVNIGIHINLFLCILLSYIIIKCDKENIIFKTFYKFYYFYLILIFLVLLYGVDPAEIYQGSRNLISQLFVIYGALFFIYKPFSNDMKFKTPFYILIVIVCILAMGRSGIISSLVLLLAVVIDNYEFKANKKNILSFLILVSLIVLGLIYEDTLLNFLQQYSKLEYLQSKGTTDSHRALMINEFLLNFKTEVLFFGLNLDELPIISSYNGNPHNSYIYLLAKLGILAVIIFMTLASFLFKLILKFKISTSLALLAILMRLSTDSPDGLITLPIIFICVYNFFFKAMDNRSY